MEKKGIPCPLDGHMCYELSCRTVSPGCEEILENLENKVLAENKGALSNDKKIHLTKNSHDNIIASAFMWNVLPSVFQEKLLNNLSLRGYEMVNITNPTKFAFEETVSWLLEARELILNEPPEEVTDAMDDFDIYIGKVARATGNDPRSFISFVQAAADQIQGRKEQFDARD